MPATFNISHPINIEVEIIFCFSHYFVLQLLCWPFQKHFLPSRGFKVLWFFVPDHLQLLFSCTKGGSRGTTKRGYYVWKPLRGGYLRVTAVSHQSPRRHLTSHTSSHPPLGGKITTNRRFCTGIVYGEFS